MTLWDRIKSILGRLLPVPFLGAVMLLCVFLSSCAGVVPMNQGATTQINATAGANDLQTIATGVNDVFTSASYWPTTGVWVTQGMLLPDLEQAAVITYSFTIDGTDGPWTPAEQAQALTIAKALALNIQAQANVQPATGPLVALAKMKAVRPKLKLDPSQAAILQNLINLVPVKDQPAFTAWLSTSGPGLLQIGIADAENAVAYWLKGNVYGADVIVFKGMTKAQRLQAGLTFLTGTQMPDTNKAADTTKFERQVASGGMSLLLTVLMGFLGL